MEIGSYFNYLTGIVVMAEMEGYGYTAAAEQFSMKARIPAVDN